MEGAQVTGISRNPQRVKSLLQAGDVQIVSDIATVRGSFDLILVSVGGESLTAALRLVGRDGIVAMFGNSSGQDSRVAFQQFSGRAHARLYAFFVYESGEPPTFGQDLGVMAQEIGAGQLHPQIGIEANWRDPLGALTALRARYGGQSRPPDSTRTEWLRGEKILTERSIMPVPLGELSLRQGGAFRP